MDATKDQKLYYDLGRLESIQCGLDSATLHKRECIIPIPNLPYFNLLVESAIKSIKKELGIYEEEVNEDKPQENIE